ncbi:polyprenyl synthetase family protein [bacterium]|nr:polyprenyl synthetase family protein [bacterium]
MNSKKARIDIYQQIDVLLSKHLACFDDAYQSHFETEMAFMAPLLSHVHNGRGKRLRPMLFLLCQGLVGGKINDDVRMAVLIELLHTASLIHDDVLDQADIRRGKDTLNTVWGNKAAVLIGDYLFTDILQLSVDIARPEVISIIARTARQMGTGELRQTLGPNDFQIDISDYFQMIEDKTASLFSTSTRFAAQIAGASREEEEELAEFGRLLGIVFQIRDDILDFIGSNSRMGKPALQDVRDGKATLPLLCALKTVDPAQRKSVLDTLQHRNARSVEYVHEFVLDNGGIQTAQHRANDLTDKALALLYHFTPGIYRDSLEKLILIDLERQE